jgi:hypothetical protein
MSIKPTSPHFVPPIPLKTEYDGNFYHQNLLLPQLLETALCNPAIINVQQEVDPSVLKTAMLFVKFARMENGGFPRFTNGLERVELYSLRYTIYKDLKKSPSHPSCFDERIAIAYMKKHSLKTYEWSAKM